MVPTKKKRKKKKGQSSKLQNRTVLPHEIE